MTDAERVKAGTRLRCAECGSEAIVTRGGDAQLQCCDTVMSMTFQPDRPAGDESPA